MTDLRAIAELVFKKFYPNPTTEILGKLEEFVLSAQVEYAYQVWRISKESKRQDGEFEIPSSLFRQSEITVKDGVAEIGDLHIFRTLEGDTWIQNIGGFGCECPYVKLTVNLGNILCDDEYLGNKRSFVVIGDRISFPQGSHKEKLPIIYASNGEDIDGSINIDDVMAGVIRRTLEEVYTQKLSADTTNNNNPNR